MSDDLTATLTTTNTLLAEVRDALEALVAGLEHLEGLTDEVRTLREETRELRLQMTPWKPEAHCRSMSGRLSRLENALL